TNICSQKESTSSRVRCVFYPERWNTVYFLVRIHHRIKSRIAGKDKQVLSRQVQPEIFEPGSGERECVSERHIGKAQVIAVFKISCGSRIRVGKTFSVAHQVAGDVTTVCEVSFYKYCIGSVVVNLVSESAVGVYVYIKMAQAEGSCDTEQQIGKRVSIHKLFCRRNERRAAIAVFIKRKSCVVKPDKNREIICKQRLSVLETLCESTCQTLQIGRAHV